MKIDNKQLKINRTFTAEIDRLTIESGLLQKKFDRISHLRLAAALPGIALFVFSLLRSSTLLFYLALVFGATFILLAIWHLRVENSWNRIKALIQINQEYLARIEGGWVNFTDVGAEFEDPAHPYSGDLDIFGNGSLFQYLSCANTYNGRIQLANLLSSPSKTETAISSRQQAVAEIATKTDFCKALQGEATMNEDLAESPEKLIEYASSPETMFKGSLAKWAFRILPAISLLTGLLAFLKVGISPLIPLALFVFQFIITAMGLKCRPVLNQVSGLQKDLSVYNSILQLIQQESFQSIHVSSLKARLFPKTASATEGIKQLNTITRCVELRYSVIVHFILNTFLLWDYHCVFALESWKARYGSAIAGWLDDIGQVEALVSLAVPQQVRADACRPHLIKGRPTLGVVALSHPLIPLDSVVPNSLKLQNRIGIVTGSNMSGKTTLLRTVGINLVLAYAGASAFASRFECSIMELFTSMRNPDDLNSGISTFYAELLRIKTIITFSREEKPMIFLLDELFKGTNSKDRIIGAKSVVANLNKAWCIGLISTHDFELCDLENNASGRIHNYHFSEYYEGDQILFDYTMKEGRCNSTNAQHLMKLAGIELTDDI